MRPICAHGGKTSVMAHQHVEMPWNEFKRLRRLQVQARPAARRFSGPDRTGHPLPDRRRGRSRSCRTELAQIDDWTKTRYGYHIPSIPKWIEPFESLNHHEKRERHPYHHDHAAPAQPHPLDLPQHRQSPVRPMTPRDDDQYGGCPDGSGCAPGTRWRCGTTAAAWWCRSTSLQRCMPGVVISPRGAWIDLDENGVDRSRQPQRVDRRRTQPGRLLCLQHHSGEHPRNQPGAHAPAGTSWRCPAATSSAATSRSPTL